jgi:acetyl esterase/lipase
MKNILLQPLTLTMIIIASFSLEGEEASPIITRSEITKTTITELEIDFKLTEPQKVSLWNNHAPVGNGKFAEEDAEISVHYPLNPNGAAVIICPGGGYGGLVMGSEGHGIATWLANHGITGIVLRYRLPNGRSFVPLMDAQRALRLVRHRAKEWKLDPKRIGIIGFSAGGHLASTVATHFDPGDPRAKEPIDRQSCRPDFSILVYPVVTMGKHTHGGSKRNLLGQEPSEEMIRLFSNEQQVTKDTPPTFLAHAVDDRPVPPENSRALYAALQKNKVPSEYIELPNGGHGLNGYKGPSWDAWQKGSLEWLAKIKMIPAPTKR